MSTKGKFFLILGPSGSGKGTLIEGLKKRHPEFIFPVSMTSRKRRKGEKNREVYTFVSKDEFEEKIENNEFLEWAIVHQKNYYGTLKKPILDAIDDNKVVIREVDIQGFEQIREIMPKDQLVSIFIIPDSIKNLIERIKKRSKISAEEVKRRIESSKNEINKSNECDYIIHNSDGKLEEAVEKVGFIEQIINPRLRQPEGQFQVAWQYVCKEILFVTRPQSDLFQIDARQG